jgi:glucose-1-phosphate cytidylyltransferase
VKVAILAGGAGTRLAEETSARPKPMVEIGGKPILWHIMRSYSHFGFDEFALALGYKAEYIKRYMLDLLQLNGALRIDYSARDVQRNGHDSASFDGVERWQVDLVDTGLETQTGGRIKRLAPYLGRSTFMLTYGDGVADVRLDDLLQFHREHGRLATITTVRPPARFGMLELAGDQVVSFREKRPDDGDWINGGFFVLEPEVLDYIDGDDSVWEREPLERLANDGQLVAYRHTSFWQCMDTLREKQVLQTLWDQGSPPWKVWGSSCESFLPATLATSAR